MTAYVRAALRWSSKARSMMDTPHVARLRVYPIKSLDGVELAEREVLPSGALRFDREFAIVDDAGAFVNGKREPRLHALRASFDLAGRSATFAAPQQGSAMFDLDRGIAALEAYLSVYLGRDASIVRNEIAGFPDDSSAPGPTFVSTATLETVAGWFDLDIESVRRRFRANVEVGGVPAFWEDRLFGGDGARVAFAAGDAIFAGVNPCARCVVPSRDPLGGDVTPAFQKRFSELRAAQLPPWANRGRFDHFYRLSVNTLGERAAGKRIAVGDRVRLL